MSKRSITFVGSLAFLLTTLFATVGFGSTAQAALPGQVGDAPRCTVESVGPRDSAFKVTGNDATVTFKVTGGENCKVQVSTNSFYAPTMNGKPYDEQILFQRVTKVYNAPGTYSITASLPPKSTPAKGCFYQVDLTYGTHNVTPVLAYGHGTLDCSQSQPPAYKCVSLVAEQISRTKYKFTANATASGGATIEKYEFGFGDGFGITVAENTYTYEYKKAGTFKTNVVVHVKVNGQVKKVTTPACEKTITVAEEKIQVCELTTKKIITINESEFDATKHSKNLNDCKEAPTPTTVQVCELATKKVITINESEFDSTKHSKDLNSCKEVPQVLASTGPGEIALGGLGLSSLTAAGYYWRASRNRLIAKLLGQ